MNFLKKLALRSYRSELKNYLNAFENASPEKNASTLIYSVWLRAILQNEGTLNPIEQIESNYNQINSNPELFAYPLMLKQFEQIIKFLKKQNQLSKAAVLLLWVHTLRAILNPEIAPEVKKLWDILLKTQNLWDEKLNLFKEEDFKLGIEPEFVNKTMELSKSILKMLPPKQLKF